jgi:hypothetical protein
MTLPLSPASQGFVCWFVARVSVSAAKSSCRKITEITPIGMPNLATAYSHLPFKAYGLGFPYAKIHSLDETP